MIATSRRRGTRAAPEPPSSAPPRSRRGRCSSEARSPRETPTPPIQGGGSRAQRSRPVPLSGLSDSARPRRGRRAGSRRSARVRAGVVGSASLLRVSDRGSSLLSHKLFQKALSTRRFFERVASVGEKQVLHHFTRSHVQYRRRNYSWKRDEHSPSHAKKKLERRTPPKCHNSTRNSTSRTTNKTLGRLRRSNRNERRVRGGRP